MADNYTQVPNWLLAKLYRADNLTFREVKVMLYLIRKLNGFHQSSDKIPYSQIAEGTGIDRRDVIRVIQSLEEKKVVSVRRKAKCTNIIAIKVVGNSPTSASGKKGQKLVGKLPPSKENQKSGLSSSPPLVGVDSQDKINNINSKSMKELLEELDDEYE